MENRKKQQSRAPEEIRLNRYIASSGLCSRREADEIILKGYISVNGKQVKDLGTKVKSDDDVRYKGKKLSSEKKVYILMNKPAGYVTTVEDPHAEHTVIDLVKNACTERIYPVGRLDKDTTGLKILSPKKHVPKTYLALLDGKLNETEKLRIEQGIDIGDETITLPAVLHYESPDSNLIRITITEGRYHQVKRMFYAVGKNVISLKRIQIGALKLDETLNAGSYRQLTENEISLCFDRTFK